jgi:hypothetical protein
VIDLANDDALNEFSPEQPRQSRPAREVTAEPPKPASPEVDASSFPDVFDSWSPEVDAAASADVYASPPPEIDAGASADVYASSNQFDPPLESSGGIQIVAAVATVGMLAVMYTVLIQQRSSVPLSVPTPVNAPTVASESDQLAAVEPPLMADDTLLPIPDVVRPRPYFDDPFGLTRGLSPSIPPEILDLSTAGSRSAAGSDSPTPPAAEPVPARASAVAPAPSTPSPEVTTPANAAASPSIAPSPSPARPPAAASAPAAAPPSAAPPPPAVASAPSAAAPSAAEATPVTPPPTAAASRTVAAPPTSTAAPPPSSAPAPTPASTSAAAVAAPAPSAPPPAASAIDASRSRIQDTLARYRKAFSSLDASAAREVWPTVNERTLGRAFERLEQQDVSFEGCQIQVNNDRAEATCDGTARYVPRVGSRTPRVDRRQWRFNLVKVRDEWLIGAVDAR